MVIGIVAHIEESRAILLNRDLRPLPSPAWPLRLRLRLQRLYWRAACGPLFGTDSGKGRDQRRGVPRGFAVHGESSLPGSSPNGCAPSQSFGLDRVVFVNV